MEPEVRISIEEYDRLRQVEKEYNQIKEVEGTIKRFVVEIIGTDNVKREIFYHKDDELIDILRKHIQELSNLMNSYKGENEEILRRIGTAKAEYYKNMIKGYDHKELLKNLELNILSIY